MYFNMVEKKYSKLHYVSLPNIFQHIKKKDRKRKLAYFLLSQMDVWELHLKNDFDR